jgi:L-asparagine transporter-like permease
LYVLNETLFPVAGKCFRLVLDNRKVLWCRIYIENYETINKKYFYINWGEVMKQKEKGLSVWQLTMMAIGTVIGGSFFIGTAVAINAAGPSVVLGFILGGFLVYFILFALSEMTVSNPAVGSFRTYASQAFGRGTGFVIGWVYWTGMVLAMSSEATAISILLRQWFPGASLPLTGCLIIISVTLINLLGAQKLSKLESGLAAIKVFAIVSFIIVAVLLVAGLFNGNPAVGIGSLAGEPFMPGGFQGIAGSILIVMFSYAGFEIIGLAASETRRPKENVPKAIRNTVFILVGLYILSITLLLPLISTSAISTNTSPFVAALNNHGIAWAGSVLSVVLITAILSTMLAAMFGLGRMMRSLADEGMAPAWLKDKKEVPYRGILASGAGMLASLAIGMLFPSVYVFLISAGGFALLFTYVVIIATHLRFRKTHGCPPDGRCQLWGYPYTSYFVLAVLAAAIVSMPFIPDQSSGMIAGSILIAFFALCYAVIKAVKSRESLRGMRIKKMHPDLSVEFSKELTDRDKKEKSDE